ncbi:hypothetical protein JSO19_03910 [Leucobacter sp. UCMA 4100]|uniref:hypothetical protein n=1 Tax=Leucobacter sp. UCMA 4100 TaxID=2810534 RepID=UPI0022EB1E29|nr:hypothetical protein [Leucobacter sp. UCMA 4100]MDA3146521.1 hypothetical protein [Leucobacter sp. UCMA 4100]
MKTTEILAKPVVTLPTIGSVGGLALWFAWPYIASQVAHYPAAFGLSWSDTEASVVFTIATVLIAALVIGSLLSVLINLCQSLKEDYVFPWIIFTVRALAALGLLAVILYLPWVLNVKLGMPTGL